MITLKGIDHFVIPVSSIDDAVAFYGRVLGAKEIRYGEGRSALAIGSQKINLHAEGRAPQRRARRPTIGSADFCVEVAGPVDSVLAHLRSVGVTVEEGPSPRNGARGTMTSVYFRDPDENLVELSVY
jgi:catechol 2,3-dioxygenase-like lactoylglutathione lyase family enzyme